MTTWQKEFNKKYKKNPILSGSEVKKLGSYIPYGISTQSLKLDLAIGCPGIPGARLTQVFGNEGVGKTSLVLHIMAACQGMGGEVALADTEDAYDMARAKKIGVKIERLTMIEPESLEELLDMIPSLAEAFFSEPGHIPGKTPFLIVVDSMEGLGAEIQMSAAAEDSHYGVEARVISKNISRLLRKTCRKYKVALLVVSQQYFNMKGNPRFGDPEFIVKGGKAIPFRASLRIEIKQGQGKSNKLFNANDEEIGYRNTFYTKKNKSAAPFKTADYMLTFDNGIDRMQDLFECGVEMGIITGTSKYVGKLGNTEFSFKGKDSWPKIVKKLGGVDKVFRMMTRYALRNGYMKLYSYEDEENPGE